MLTDEQIKTICDKFYSVHPQDVLRCLYIAIREALELNDKENSDLCIARLTKAINESNALSIGQPCLECEKKQRQMDENHERAEGIIEQREAEIHALRDELNASSELCPPCTLPFKEGEYAPEFDVALGKWVSPKYKRCPECEKRNGPIVIHDLAEQLHSAGLSALECPKCQCGDIWHDYRKKIASALCKAVNK